VNVGQLFATLKLDTTEFESSLSRVESEGTSFASRTGNRMGLLLAAGFAAAAGAVAAFGASSVSVASDFEAGMNRFRSVTGSAVEDAGLTLDDFKNKFLELGSATQFSAAEAQQAAIELAKGGVGVEDILGGATQAALDLAAAGELDLAPAAEIVAKQLGVWGETGVQASDVADLLAQAANASTVDVDDLALGLAQAGGTAKVTGVEFRDLVQSMALIAPNFQSASDAGTSLKTFLARLAPQTDAAKDAMAELGLYSEQTGSAFFDAQGNFIGMEAAARILHAATKDLSEEQRLQAFNTIFGSDAIRAAAAIANAGAEGFNAMGVSMAAAGSAAEQAAIRNQGFKFAMDELMGAVETLQIVLGTLLLPLLTAIINEGLKPMVEGVIALVQSFTAAGGGAEQLQAQMLPVMAQLQAVTTAVLAIILAAWQSVQPGINAFGESITQAAGVVAGIMPAIQTTIQAALSLVTAFWQQNGSSIVGATNQAFTLAGSIIGGAMQLIASIITGVLAALVDFWRSHGNTLMAATTAIWQVISNVILAALNLIDGLIKAALAIFQGDWQGAWTTIQVSFGAAWNNIVVALKAALDLIRISLTFWLGQLQSVWNAAWSAISNVASSTWNAIKQAALDAAKGLVSEVVSTIKGLKDFFGGIASGLGSAARSIGSAIIDGIKNGISSAAGKIADAARSAAESALRAAKRALGIQSPSKVFEREVGAQISAGLARGILGGQGLVVAASTQTAAASAGASQRVVNYHINANYAYQPERRLRDDIRLLQMMGAGL